MRSRPGRNQVLKPRLLYEFPQLLQLLDLLQFIVFLATSLE